MSFPINLASSIDISGLPQANDNIVTTIIAIVIAVTAAISLLFIVIGGFRYILSEGDPQAVSKAKGTVLYALIGLAVAALAQAIVIFVIRRV